MYLWTYFENRAKPPETQLREVMMDESYIHEHYHKCDDSCWDPNDDQDIMMSKAPAKGRRYCFAAAIQGPDPRVESPSTPEERAGLVPNTVWAFCPQKKGDHQGDYHKVFNGSNFLVWWREQLLPNLNQPSLIMLDNAKYHHVYDDDVARPGKMKKHELIDFVIAHDIERDPWHLTALELKVMVNQWILANEKIAVIKSAEAAGHTVLFTPPLPL